MCSLYVFTNMRMTELMPGTSLLLFDAVPIIVRDQFKATSATVHFGETDGAGAGMRACMCALQSVCVCVLVNKI